MEYSILLDSKLILNGALLNDYQSRLRDVLLNRL